MNDSQLCRLRTGVSLTRTVWNVVVQRRRTRADRAPRRAGPCGPAGRLDVSRRRRLPTVRVTERRTLERCAAAADDHWLNVRRRTGCLTWVVAGRRGRTLKLMDCCCSWTAPRLFQSNSRVMLSAVMSYMLSDVAKTRRRDACATFNITVPSSSLHQLTLYSFCVRRPQQALHWEVSGFKRGPGRPRTNWRSRVNKGLLRMGVTWEEAEVAA